MGSSPTWGNLFFYVILLYRKIKLELSFYLPPLRLWVAVLEIKRDRVRVPVYVRVRDDVRLLDFDLDFERDFDCVEEGVLLVENVSLGVNLGDNIPARVAVTFGDNVNKYDADGLAEEVAELLDVPVFDGLPEILGTEDTPIIAAAPRIIRKRNIILTILSSKYFKPSNFNILSIIVCLTGFH